MALLIATVLPAAAQEPFKRNLEQVGFVPKGAWIAGVSVSYQQSDQNNYQFLVFENINGDTYTFKVSPTVLFSFKDNLAAGGRFSYSRQRTHLSSADIVLDSETSYNIDNLYSISHNYHGTALFRAYFSLGRSTRFGMFNVNVGLAPGLVVFLNNYSALEVNVGVLGFNYRNTRSVTDQIYVANRTSKHANFKINLFSITFGVAFYI